MKTFETPKAEIVMLNSAEIIVTSSCTENTDTCSDDNNLPDI